MFGWDWEGKTNFHLITPCSTALSTNDSKWVYLSPLYLQTPPLNPRLYKELNSSWPHHFHSIHKPLNQIPYWRWLKPIIPGFHYLAHLVPFCSFSKSAATLHRIGPMMINNSLSNIKLSVYFVSGIPDIIDTALHLENSASL